MTSQALYDLSPLLRVMLVGMVLALGPLMWVGLRNRNGSPASWLQALTLVTLFLTFDLVLFGAFTRLTDSGLGCPDWPGCYGNASPLGAQAEIAVAHADMPTGPVSPAKAWIEMVHRYLATGVGVLILVLAAAGWLRPSRKRGAGLVDTIVSPALSAWWPGATLAWVCLQGAFGALTVTMKLFPAIVTLHLMGGLVLLVLLTVQVLHQNRDTGAGLPQGVGSGTRLLLWVTVVALAVQIALGGWVSTNYAVLACNDFPRCQGSWWPAMDFDQGFDIWRRLGMTSAGDHLNFSALTAIHFAHRAMAGVVLLLMGLLALLLNAAPGLRAQSRWLAALTGLQLVTGLSNVVMDWPLFAALMHTGGAAALAIVMTWIACTIKWSERTSTAIQTGAEVDSGSAQGVLNIARLKHE